jgi:hypothetical protein
MTDERTGEAPPIALKPRIPYPKGEPPSNLWHYTNQNGLVGILESAQLWATGVRFLNDDQEFTYAKGLALEELDARMQAETGKLHQYIKVVLATLDTVDADPSVGAFAFSEVEDDLGQWRGYGTGGGAYALVFDGPELKTRFPVIPLVRCEYDPEQQRYLIREWIAYTVQAAKNKIRRGAKSLVDKEQYYLLVEMFSRMAPALKHPAFRAEREWRLIARAGVAGMTESVRSTPSGLRPTMKVPLNEHLGACLRSVVVGPMPDQNREMAAVERLLEQQNLLNVSVTASTVPFRTW